MQFCIAVVWTIFKRVCSLYLFKHFSHVYHSTIHRIPSMQFAVIIILLVLPSSLVYTFCTLLYLSWGCFVTCICTKDCVTFLYNSLLLQSISKHTNVAYIWRDTTSIYTWYISLVYCCIFCTLHPSTHHLFDCCIFIDRYHVKRKHPLISYDGVCLMAVLYLIRATNDI